MAVDQQRLQYILDMVDNVTGPARRVGASVKAMADDVNKAQKEVTDLQRQASDIQGLTDMQKALAKASQRAQELSQGQASTKAALDAAKAAQRAHTSELNKAEKALAKATTSGKQDAQTVATLTQRVNTLRAAHASGAAEVTRLTAEHGRFKAEIKTATGEVGRHQKAVTAASARLKAMGVDTDNLGNAQRTTQERMESANRTLSRHQRALDVATAKQERVTKAKEQYNAAQERANKLIAAGGKAMLAGGALMGGTVLAADPYRKFDKGMSAVQATGRMDDETKAALMAIVDKLATDSVFNHVEAAGAAGFLAQSGMNDKQIADSLGGVMSLAAATGSDLMRTADIASNILSGFQLDADQMGRVGDVLTMAANSFNVDLSMLGETMKYLAPVASKLGVSMEEATAMAGLLGNVGIQGSQAGNALKSMAGSLAAPNKKKDAILDGLGITAKDKNGDMRSMPELLKELQVKTKGMGNADLTAMFKTLFGEEFYGPAMEIVAKGGEVLDKAISDMANAKGAAAEAEAKRLDNLDGDIIKFSNQVSAAQVKFGAQMDGIYRKVTQAATGALDSLNAWMARNPAMVRAIGLVTVALGALLAAVGAVIVVLGTMWLAMAKVRLMMILLRWATLDTIRAKTLMQVRSLALAAALAVQTAAMGGSRLAMLAMAVAARSTGLAMVLSLGLVGVAIAAVIAAVALLVKHWDIVKAFGAGVWDGFIEGVRPLLTVIDEFLDALGPVGDAMRWVGGLLADLGGWFMSLFEPVNYTKEQLAAAGESGKQFGAVIAMVFRALVLPVRAAMEVIKFCVGQMKAAWDAVYVFLAIDPMGTLRDLWDGIPAWFGGLWDSAVSGMSAAFDTILGLLGLDPMVTIQEAWGGLGDWFISLGATIYDAIAGALNGAWERVTSIGGAIKDFVTTGGGLWGTVPEAVKDAPVKDQSTGQVKTPPAMKQGGQITPPKPVVNNNITAPTTLNFTSTAGDPKMVRSELEKLLAERDARLDRQLRARQGD